MSHPVITDDVAAACDAAARAWGQMNPFSSDTAGFATRRAAALETLAGELEARREEILRVCVEETALLEAELAPEFARMTGTLRLMATAARGGAWRRAAHDAPAVAPAAAIGPNHDLSTELVPLGPVAVFGASNFPLAYGVCGGDTASALAAGCPVVVKEHPAHPRLGRLLAQIAGDALVHAGLPAGMFGYVLNEDPDDHAPAQRLVTHAAIRAVGFTGSERGGMALDRLARERVDEHSRPDPIPVFAEMGSVNPVFVTPGAMATRAEAIADVIADSVLLRHGQQCTCPGLVFVASSPDAERLTTRLATRVAASTAREMLTRWVRNAFEVRTTEMCYGRERETSRELVAIGQDRTSARADRLDRAVLLVVPINDWLESVELHEEAFGPAVVVVHMPAWSDHAQIPRHALRGSLTLSIFADASDPDDVVRAMEVVAHHGHIAGRIIWNGVPTGVRACEAMVHGGPYPATNRPDSTACGPRAIERWCRPVCWQNWPVF